jgi:hypothetical protein
MAETEAKKPEATTVRELFQDPKWEAYPLDMKLEKFQKAKKEDLEFQKMSDAGQTHVHQKLFAGETKETEALAQSPETPGPATPQETAAARERIGLPPEEPTRPGTLAGTIESGVVKGLESPVQLASAGANLLGKGAEAVGLLSPQTPEQAKLAAERATPIQSYITGPQLSPDTPGYRVLEHVVENVVGTAVAAPVVRYLLPALSAGKTLTKDVIEQAIHAAIAAVPGQAVKEAGGGAVPQIGAEMGTTSITGMVESLWKAIKGRPGMVRYLETAAQKENPDLAKSIQTSERAKAEVPGYTPTMAETTGSDIIAGTAKQLEKDQPVEFGIPYKQQVKGNVDAAIAKIDSVLGKSDEGVIGAGIETAQKPVLLAKQEHEFLTGVHRDLQEESRLLNDRGVQELRASQDAHYATVVKAEGDIRAAEDAATQAKQSADQLLRDTKEKGVALDTAQLKQYRDAEDEALRLKQKAQDSKTQALQASQDSHQVVAGEARTATKEASEKTAALKDELTRVQTQNEADLATTLEHQRKTFAKGAPAVAEGGEAAYREHVTKLGEAARTFYTKMYERTFGEGGIFNKAYTDLYARHNVVGDEKFKTNFVDTIRKDGTFEGHMVDRMQASYQPDPALQEIRDYIMQKAEKAGLDDMDSLNAYMHKGSTEAPSLNVTLNLEDLAKMRSRVMQDLRGTAADSPRRRTLNNLVDVLNGSMESMASTKPEALAELRELNAAYRTEKLRHVAGPGKMAEVKNPRTGESLYPADYVGKNLFGSAPAGSASLTDARHVEMFGQHMQDLDHAIEDGFVRGDFVAVGEARREKNLLLDHAKNEFYMSYMDEASGKPNPAKAEKWVRDHQALIDQSPDLKKAFATNKDRLAAIREVEASNQGLEAEARGLLQESEREGKVIKSAGSEAVAKSRREMAITKREAGVVATTSEREASADFTQKKRSFEDIAREQAEAERQAALAKQDVSTQAQSSLTDAQREAETAKRLSSRGTVETQRSIEDLKAAAREKLRVAAENVKASEERLTAQVEEWKKGFGGTGPFTDPLNQDIAQQKLGAQPKDFIERVEHLPERDQRIAYDRLFAASKGDPALRESVIAGMWEHFMENLKPEQLDTGKKATLVGEFLKSKGRILKEHMPQYVKDLEMAQEVLDRAARAANATTEGVPTGLKAIPRGLMRVQDVAVTIGARALGVPFHIAGMAGMGAEILSRMSNAARSRVQKEIFLNPDSTALLAKINNPGVNPSWKKAAMKTILFRSGITANEVEGE